MASSSDEARVTEMLQQTAATHRNKHMNPSPTPGAHTLDFARSINKIGTSQQGQQFSAEIICIRYFPLCLIIRFCCEKESGAKIRAKRSPLALLPLALVTLLSRMATEVSQILYAHSFGASVHFGVPQDIGYQVREHLQSSWVDMSSRRLVPTANTKLRLHVGFALGLCGRFVNCRVKRCWDEARKLSRFAVLLRPR